MWESPSGGVEHAERALVQPPTSRRARCRWRRWVVRGVSAASVCGAAGTTAGAGAGAGPARAGRWRSSEGLGVCAGETEDRTRSGASVAGETSRAGSAVLVRPSTRRPGNPASGPLATSGERGGRGHRAARNAGWALASKRGQKQHSRNAGQGGGVDGVDAEQQAGEGVGDQRAGGDAEHGPGADPAEPGAEDRAGLRCRGGAERAADGQLAAPLDLRVGEHRVQPREAERERGGGEQLEQPDPGAACGEDTLEQRLTGLDRRRSGCPGRPRG